MRKKSEKEKKLSGTYRKDRSKRALEGLEMDSIPDPPDYLSTAGTMLYYAAADFLNRQGLLNQVVSTQVAMYAFAVDSFKKAVDKIKKEGETSPVYSKEGKLLYYVTNPLVKIATMHMKNAAMWSRHLLLPPMDVDRLPEKPKDDADDPFADLR